MSDAASGQPGVLSDDTGTVDLAEIGRLLAAREDELVAETEEMTKPPTELGTISFGKRVGDGTQMAVDRMVAVSAHSNLTQVLDEVRRARARLADGTYGTCDQCGRPIPVGRLEARPWATRCVGCS